MNRAGRRRFLHGAGALFAFPLAAGAQQPARIPRIGVMAGPSWQRDAVRQGLQEHGWIDGKNVRVEYRSASPTAEAIANVAREFVSLRVDCIVAAGNQAIGIVKQVAPAIPLVMAHAADPVGSGFVASLPRPGGNVTGHSNINEALAGKRIELLKELDPRLTRIAILRNPSIGAHDAIWKQAQSTAAALGLGILSADYRSAEDFESAFALIAREKANGLVVPQSPVVSLEHARIVGFAARRGLPAVYQSAPMVERGGLMSYAADEADMWRRAARYVDKILKGTKPADLPVEQPAKFELILNLRTAKALGITIPHSILLQATRVIE